MREKIDRVLLFAGLYLLGGILGFLCGVEYEYTKLNRTYQFEGAGPGLPEIPQPPAGHFYTSLPLDMNERKAEIAEMYQREVIGKKRQE